MNVSECMHSSAAIILTRDTCPRSFTGVLIDMHCNTESCKFITDKTSVSLESNKTRLTSST